MCGYLCICVPACVCACVQVYEYAFVSAYLCVCVCVCAGVQVCLCVGVLVCVRVWHYYVHSHSALCACVCTHRTYRQPYVDKGQMCADSEQCCSPRLCNLGVYCVDCSERRLCKRQGDALPMLRNPTAPTALLLCGVCGGLARSTHTYKTASLSRLHATTVGILSSFFSSFHSFSY